MTKPDYFDRLIQDERRIAAVHATGLLDTPPEPEFDRIVKIAAHVMEAPISLVSIVDERYVFVKAQVGLPPASSETRHVALHHALCPLVVAGGPLFIDDCAAHPLTRDHPLVREFGVAAYAGLPIVEWQGQRVGVLCVADTRARSWEPDGFELMTELASVVIRELELRDLRTLLLDVGDPEQLLAARVRRTAGAQVTEVHVVRGRRFE